MPKETTYLVECNLSVLSDKDRRAMQRAVQQASTRLTVAGSPVRYLGSLFVPARSRCFSVFEAVSIEAVRSVSEAALVPYIAINEAIDLWVSAPGSGVDGQRGWARRKRTT